MPPKPELSGDNTLTASTLRIARGMPCFHGLQLRITKTGVTVFHAFACAGTALVTIHLAGKTGKIGS
jgi:hypothetical protein